MCQCNNDLMRVFEYWLVAGSALLVCWYVGRPLLERAIPAVGALFEKLKFW